jgi:Zn-dependent peptidase ImmA (M78 family)
MIDVPINPDVLKWAIDRSGLSVDQISRNFVDITILNNWILGKAVPTLTQAETLATKLRIPLPVLLLDERPQDELPIPDLRTIDPLTPRQPSPEFVDTVNDAVVRQSWYREHLLATGAHAVPFVGQFTMKDRVSVIAQSIRANLQIDERLRLLSRSWKDFLLKLVQHADAAGVVVMRNSIVRNDVNRKLTVEEFRGFAISDLYAPLVFINSRDAKAAQIFTLAHELAHLWLGATGISNPDPRKRSAELRAGLEQLCNEIAAEVLVPRELFLRMWSVAQSIDTNVKRIATHFRVSSIVTLRRAHEFDKITQDEFKKRVSAEYARFRAMEEKELEKQEESTGNFWNLFLMRNGQTFTDTVAKAASAGTVPFVYASDLLGVKAPTLDRYITRFRGALR